MAKHTDFSRLGGTERPAPKRRNDARAALFTDAAPAPAPEAASPAAGTSAAGGDRDRERGSGWFVLDCSSCGERTHVGLLGIAWAATPSLHLPLLRRHHPSFMRCPSCNRHRWVTVSIDLRG